VPNPENLRPFPKGNQYGVYSKRGKSLKPVLEKLLNQIVEIENKKTGEMTEMTVEQAVAMSLIKEATKANIGAIKELYDRYYGKVIQPTTDLDSEAYNEIEHTSANDEIINEQWWAKKLHSGEYKHILQNFLQGGDDKTNNK
jgi:hypothetical protein